MPLIGIKGNRVGWEISFGMRGEDALVLGNNQLVSIQKWPFFPPKADQSAGSLVRV